MADESKGDERPDLTTGGVPERLSFPGTEEAVLALWKHLDAFKTQLRLTEVRCTSHCRVAFAGIVCVWACVWAGCIFADRGADEVSGVGVLGPWA